MIWTTPADLRHQLTRLWDRGLILAILAGEAPLFPRRLMLKKPSSTELSLHFQEVRQWIQQLEQGAKHYRIIWQTQKHRFLGTNSIPKEIWVDSLEDALTMLGRQKDAVCFEKMVSLCNKRYPQLLAWLKKHPLKGLQLSDHWPRFLDIIDWFVVHPNPDVYLRQIDIPGIHSKFIEQHRTTLTELLDLVLPEDAIDDSARGKSGFCKRYGLRDKPVRIRFRLLDPRMSLPYGGEEQDITLTGDGFSQLDLQIEHVIITENEINFLTFPGVAMAMVIFGAGYGFDILAKATWLQHRKLYYWGDIDTHGFAILDQFRKDFPQARSFLMDLDTLLGHQSLWGEEKNPETRKLYRLTPEEAQLYNNLCTNHHGENIRIEQEHIGYTAITSALTALGVRLLPPYAS